MGNLYNKEFITKDKKTKAKEFAGFTRSVIKKNKKHFVLIYDYDEKTPSNSKISFDCADISLPEIMSVMKQFMMQLQGENTTNTN